MPKKKKEIIRLEREALIPILKPKLIKAMSQQIEDESNQAEFMKLCKRIEYTIRAWYLINFEDMMYLYSFFDPIHGARKLEQQHLSDADIDEFELRFLNYLFQVMSKSNFKITSDEEVLVARSARYRLNLEIKVDETKIDKKIFTRFFEKYPHEGLPAFADKYIIFRRGIGTDQTTEYFIDGKINTILLRIWWFVLRITGIQRLFFKKRQQAQSTQTTTADELVEISSEADQNYLSVERIRIENMRLSIPTLVSKVTVQEPTFQRIIVVYRPINADNLNERSIFVKHFKDIPMADMEIVLPEKQNPNLTPMDWVKFLVSAVIGMVTVVGSLSNPTADPRVIFAILSAVVGYCVKTYLSFTANLVSYQSLITSCVYDKQLDTGRGTLLHLCDECIQQEVKEVIVSYFILMQQGKASKEVLDKRCEEFIKTEFDALCNFDVDDAVKKLEKLGIVSQDEDGNYTCVNLLGANEIIGTTTEEVVLNAEQGGVLDNARSYRTHDAF